MSRIDGGENRRWVGSTVGRINGGENRRWVGWLLLLHYEVQNMLTDILAVTTSQKGLQLQNLLTDVLIISTYYANADHISTKYANNTKVCSIKDKLYAISCSLEHYISY